MSGYRKIGLLTWLLCLLTTFCLAEEFSGRVVAVKDGDTLEVLGGSKTERIRIADIDCPEMGQSFGSKAKQLTSSLVFRKEVVVKSTGRDRYGRMIGEVFVDGENLGEELVKSGAAWWFQKYSSKGRLRELEVEARNKKCGLWAGKNPIAPWDWRIQKRTRSRNKANNDEEHEKGGDNKW